MTTYYFNQRFKVANTFMAKMTPFRTLKKTLASNSKWQIG